jgi:4-amino-4-deoxychorismate lyase
LVYDDEIEYSYKYENRERLNELKERRQDCDEIMIVKNGCITDTSFSNLVFYDGKKYLTPAQPLLNGTKRKLLLQQGWISEATIKPEDLNNFQHCGLINAMLNKDDYQIITPKSPKGDFKSSG